MPVVYDPNLLLVIIAPISTEDGQAGCWADLQRPLKEKHPKMVTNRIRRRVGLTTLLETKALPITQPPL